MQLNDIFAHVKETVPISLVIERYGVKIGRGNMIHCMFHEDKHASAKLYADKLHCFTCNRSWDVVAFVSELCGIKPIDAARRLADDFNLSEPPQGLALKVKEDRMLVGALDAWFATALENCLWFRDYLEEEAERLAPKTPDDDFSDSFVDIARQWPVNEGILDMLVHLEGEKDKVIIYKQVKEAVAKIEKFRASHGDTRTLNASRA